MVNFSEVVDFFTGNGFTDSEALQVSVQVAGLADINKVWVEGVSLRLLEDGNFNNLDPQNEWQDEITRVLSSGLTRRERQCYFLSEVKGMKPTAIGRLLGVSASAVITYVSNVEYKLIADTPLEVTDLMLEQLTDRDRECYMLHSQHGMSYYGIGKKLGINHTAARQHIRKAKLRLHKLSERGVEM